METQHEYEEREADDERREDMHETQRRVLPRNRTARKMDEIIADARCECSDRDDFASRTACLVAYLAKQIEILERKQDGKDS